jgi:hypothetical protein
LEESTLECYLVNVWAHEHKQVSPSEYFQEYPTNVRKYFKLYYIFFNMNFSKI